MGQVLLFASISMAQEGHSFFLLLILNSVPHSEVKRRKILRLCSTKCEEISTEFLTFSQNLPLTDPFLLENQIFWDGLKVD
jgi:hypothetical protein